MSGLAPIVLPILLSSAAAPTKLDVNKAEFKPGNGLELSSQDGRFKMVPRFRVQFRTEVEAESTNEDPANTTFMLRRARLQFKGNLFGKYNKYKVEFAFSPRDLGFKDGRPTKTPVLTWYAQFAQLRDLQLRVGQYKVPFNRQRVVSSGNLELVDRTLANGEFNLDRDVGLDIRSRNLFGLGHKLSYYLGMYMGEGRDAFLSEDVEGAAGGFMYLGRLEFNPMGKFKDYSESDLNRYATPKLSLGAALAFHDRAKKNRGIKGSNPSDGGTTDYKVMTADMMFKWQGLAAFGEFFWREGDRTFGEDRVDAETGASLLEAARNGVGWSAQLSYVVPKIPFSVAARFSQVMSIGNNSSLNEKAELGGGLGYYFAGHPLKLQADYFRKWEQGGLAQGVDIVRAQLQVAY